MTQRGKSGGFAPPALGGASLLVIFAVLALTVFALLSLSTVRADVRLGDASAQAVVNYYAADGRAQEILACLRTGAPAPEDIPVILASGNRTLAGPTVPPGGLYLTKLWYEDERLNG